MSRASHALAFALTLIASLPAMAESTEQAFQQSLNIRSVFEAQAWSPQVTVPLIVEDLNGGAPPEIISALIQDAQNICVTKFDPYRKNVLLLRCKSEVESFRLKLTVKSADRFLAVNYGPLKIKNVQSGLVPIDKEPVPEDPIITLGRSLYDVNCWECHRTPSVLAGRTLQQLNSAINAIPRMKERDSLRALTTSQKEMIIRYLGSDL